MARILIVDDDPNILRNVREILEDEGPAAEMLWYGPLAEDFNP